MNIFKLFRKDKNKSYIKKTVDDFYSYKYIDLRPEIIEQCYIDGVIKELHEEAYRNGMDPNDKRLKTTVRVNWNQSKWAIEIKAFFEYDMSFHDKEA